MEAKKNLIFVIYDSILNSVFYSMVLSPLIEKLNLDPNLHITLISFERNKIPENKTDIPKTDRLKVVLLKRPRFFGKSSFIFSIQKLKSVFKKYPGEIIARGPLAGYITLKATNNPFTVQARGLCAEEYRYTQNYKKSNFLKTAISKLIYKQFKNIEHTVYASNKVLIESVSCALKTYITENFKAKKNKITIINDDIPSKFSKEEIIFFRKEVREKLSIDETKFVYCYSGSAQPWQCIEDVVDFFKQELSKQENIFLLVLTQETNHFEKLFKDNFFPKNSYKVISINPEILYQYLSACDAGLLFRKKDIVNWVSRPTKLLEYQSVGLKIIHNNTIAYLTEDSAKKRVASNNLNV
ncbi:hypothetical protein KAW80_03730 [Candidatus Babeliales bacterium]|nr:hypothetical protein [Candidatus Babeliales bacterium]